MKIFPLNAAQALAAAGLPAGQAASSTSTATAASRVLVVIWSPYRFPARFSRTWAAARRRLRCDLQTNYTALTAARPAAERVSLTWAETFSEDPHATKNRDRMSRRGSRPVRLARARPGP